MYRKSLLSATILTSLRLRYALVAAICLLASVVALSFVPTSYSASPAGGTVSESNPKITWTGAIMAPNAPNQCDSANNSACDNFKLTITPPSASYGPYMVQIKLLPQGDWDMQVFDPSGQLVDGSGNGAGGLEVVTLVNPPAGTYTVAANPFSPTVGTDGNSYAASAELSKFATTYSTSGADLLSYHNYQAPDGLGTNSGEPSIGVNWKTNNTMFIAGLQTLRVSFNDSKFPAKATWENKSFLTTNTFSLDPILFTDRKTGRTFVSQLVSALGQGAEGCSLTAYTDNDGDTWVQSEGCGLPTSGSDHQSIGGGPFAAPLTRDPNGAPNGLTYPNTVYYCSQSGVNAFCARSDDGGVTFGPGISIYTTECGGLHGHPMVSPKDGTVYVPNRGCDGEQALVFSEDNGLTWSISRVPDSLKAANDPALGIGANGTIYFGYQNADGHPRVAVGHKTTNHTINWEPSKDVGLPFHIQNTVFPRVVAGDDDRAAFAFLGTPTPGNFQDLSFTGEWHLYIASTFDAGQTWTTVDATPGDPVQRGSIWMQGGSNPGRNLLDFMGSAIDRDGRLLIGYADGCVTARCIAGEDVSGPLGVPDGKLSGYDNDRTAIATIARQTHGRRLFAASDPDVEPSPSPTATPAPTPPIGDPCTTPGRLVVSDASGDQNDAPANAQLDLRSVSIAEPLQSDGTDRLVFTIKVDNLNPAPQPNGDWQLTFVGTDGTLHYVEMNTYTGIPSYEYGHFEVDPTTGLNNITFDGTADSGSNSPDGTITITVAKSKLNVATAAGGRLLAVQGKMGLLAGAGVGLVLPVDESGVNDYTLVGNSSCGTSGTPTPTPTPDVSPTPNPTGDACLTGQTQIVSDPSGDQADPIVPAQAGPKPLDIQSLSAGEDYRYINSERLLFKLKVDNLNSIPANSVWRVLFTFTPPGGTATTYYVAMKSDANSGVSYEYGTQSGNLLTTLGNLDEGSYSNDGTVTLALAMVKVGSSTQGTAKAGSTLTSVNGLTEQATNVVAGTLFSTVDDTGSGSYTVRAKDAACTPVQPPLPPGSATYVKGGIAFSPNYALRAPVASRDGEPSLRVDKFGNAYVAGIRGVPAGVDLWHFDLNPNSPTYDPYMRNPIYRGQPDQFSPDEAMEVGADGGGDVDLAVGFDESSPNNPPYLAFSSLVLANVSTARSTDRGATFTKNPVGSTSGGVPVDDRQWMEFYGKDTVYLLYRTVSPVVAYVQRSTDGGLTYGPATPVGTIGQVGGIDVDQHDGTVYVSGNSGVVAVGVPAAPGLEPVSYTVHNVVPAGNANIFFTVKVADDGTVYVCYSNGKNVFIKYSKDKGTNWSVPVRISDGPETATSLLPWMETGPTPGSIGVVWYGSSSTSNSDNADWKVFFAQSLDITAPNPTIRQTEVSDHFIHGSNVSLAGLPLDPTAPSGNRNLIDYFQIGFDPTGAAVIAFTDDHNDFDGHTYVARQISGPSVKGGDIPAPVEGASLPAAAPAGPKPSAESVGGIPGSQVTDFRHDVRTSNAALDVDDPFDILSIKYSTEGPADNPVLVATMKVSDLPAVIPPNGTWRINLTANAPGAGLSPTGDYNLGLSDRGDQFFLRASTDLAGAPTFGYGTAARRHFVAGGGGGFDYTDVGTADGGSFDTTNDTITVKVSLSKLNAAMPAGHTPIGPGSILAGLRGSAFTAVQGNSGRSDNTRGGTVFIINSGSPTACNTNVAAASRGATITASSEYGAGFPASAVIDGDRQGQNWGSGGGWNDATYGQFPDSVVINLGVTQSISEVDVYSVQDSYSSPVEPTDTMTFNNYGVTDFQVQIPDGNGGWQDVPDGHITNNNLVKRRVALATPVTTDKIRVVVNGSIDGAYSRLVEVEAFSCNPQVVASPTPTPTPTPTPSSCATNVAAASYGASITASSEYGPQFSASSVIDGEHQGQNWGSGGGWNDATYGQFPDSVVINLGVTQSISEVDVYSVQDNYSNPVEPTDTMTFNNYGVTDFQVQIPDGNGGWQDVPGGHVTGNNLVKRRIVLATPVTTNQIRVLVNDSADHAFSRLVEVEAFSCSPQPNLRSALEPQTPFLWQLEKESMSLLTRSYPDGALLRSPRNGFYM